MTTLQGGCLCGKIRYELETAPLTVIQCHCRNCQRQSGSAFSVNLVYKLSQVSMNKADLACYRDTADSGNLVYRYFCPECGSPIVTGNEGLTGIGVIKAGTLDETAGIRPKMSIWECSAQDWVVPLPGIHHFRKEAERS